MAADGWVAQALHVAAKLSIADVVGNGARTPAEIAAATGSDSEVQHRLLRMLVLTNGGRERSEAEYGKLLEQAGFRLVRTIPTCATASLIEAVPVAEAS